MVEERGQYGAIAHSLEGFLGGCDEQLARLVVAESGRLAFLAFHPRALNTLDRIVSHGVVVAKILKKRGQR
jgi:hypothetical protein